jgi:excisionase family DNA binding protein
MMEWMTTEEVAKTLGYKSVKSVERLVKSGDLHPETRQEGQARRNYFRREEVEAFAAGRPEKTVRPALIPTDTDGHGRTDAGQSLDRRTRTDTDGHGRTDTVKSLNRRTRTDTDGHGRTDIETVVGALADAVALRLTKEVPIAEKLSLSIREAGQISGISQTELRDAIKSGRLLGRRTGRGQRIERETLRAFVHEFFAPHQENDAA